MCVTRDELRPASSDQSMNPYLFIEVTKNRAVGPELLIVIREERITGRKKLENIVTINK